jgi:hypothetical protein
MSHHRGHFYRAVLEGIAYSLFDAMQVLSEAGLAFKDLRIGGGAKSPAVAEDRRGCDGDAGHGFSWCPFPGGNPG